MSARSTGNLLEIAEGQLRPLRTPVLVAGFRAAL
jgi:hypothetical protein